jgi:hypothetical protein
MMVRVVKSNFQVILKCLTSIQSFKSDPNQPAKEIASILMRFQSAEG